MTQNVGISARTLSNSPNVTPPDSMKSFTASSTAVFRVTDAIPGSMSSMYTVMPPFHVTVGENSTVHFHFPVLEGMCRWTIEAIALTAMFFSLSALDGAFKPILLR